MKQVIFVSVGTDSLDPVLNSILSDDERIRARRLLRRKDRNAYVVAHALKRLVLSTECSVGPHDLLFSYDAFGKPFLLNNTVHFNLSHTTGMVALAWSASYPVGIDVECRGSQPYDKTVARMVLSEIEYDKLQHAQDCQAEFIKLWTMKEAVAKAEGKGMQMDFREITSLNNKVMLGAGGWNIQHFEPSPKYIACLATPTMNYKGVMTCETLTEDDLVNMASTSKRRENTLVNSREL